MSTVMSTAAKSVHRPNRLHCSTPLNLRKKTMQVTGEREKTRTPRML